MCRGFVADDNPDTPNLCAEQDAPKAQLLSVLPRRVPKGSRRANSRMGTGASCCATLKSPPRSSVVTFGLMRKEGRFFPALFFNWVSVFLVEA